MRGLHVIETKSMVAFSPGFVQPSFLSEGLSVSEHDGHSQPE
jgi:hypothetical protein